MIKNIFYTVSIGVFSLFMGMGPAQANDPRCEKTIPQELLQSAFGDLANTMEARPFGPANCHYALPKQRQHFLTMQVSKSSRSGDGEAVLGQFKYMMPNCVFKPAGFGADASVCTLEVRAKPKGKYDHVIIKPKGYGEGGKLTTVLFLDRSRNYTVLLSGGDPVTPQQILSLAKLTEERLSKLHPAIAAKGGTGTASSGGPRLSALKLDLSLPNECNLGQVFPMPGVAMQQFNCAGVNADRFNQFMIAQLKVDGWQNLRLAKTRHANPHFELTAEKDDRMITISQAGSIGTVTVAGDTPGTTPKAKK